MKKLIALIAVAAVSCVCSASTVKWNVTNIYTCDSQGVGKTATADKATAGSYYVMCFLESNLNLADATTMLGKGDVTGLAAKATYLGVTTALGTYSSSNYDGGYAANDTVSLYAVVFNAADASKATYGAISSSPSSYTFSDSAQDKTVAVNMKTATQGTWTAVPEPTSGLLLLLGMAGLALKRKIA